MMAKSLIRNRHAVTKLHGLKSQLQAISLRIQARSWGEKGGGVARALVTKAAALERTELSSWQVL